MKSSSIAKHANILKNFCNFFSVKVKVYCKIVSCYNDARFFFLIYIHCFIQDSDINFIVYLVIHHEDYNTLFKYFFFLLTKLYYMNFSRSISENLKLSLQTILMLFYILNLFII
jgi:hypothetical protein